MRVGAVPRRVALVSGIVWLAFRPGGALGASVAQGDTIISAACEGGVVPIGVVIPDGWLAPGCGSRSALLHGTGPGPHGRYGLLDLPVCSVRSCAHPGSLDRLTCEIAHGTFCCSEILIDREIPALPGARTGPLRRGLETRWTSDTDRRPDVCHAEYRGNGQRVLRVLVVEPTGFSPGSAYRVVGFARFFLLALPAGASDELVGEFVPVSVP